MLKLHVLASGSRGNAAIVENGATGEGVLIDCGICKRDLFERAEEASFDLSFLRAVLITHDHSDHTKGLGVALRGLARAGVHPTVHASNAVLRASDALRQAVASVEAPFRPFDGRPFRLAGMEVLPFRTSHDAAESFGFRFDEVPDSLESTSEGTDEVAALGTEEGAGTGTPGGDSLGFMTDTGIVTDEARAALSGVCMLALESNHDARMLEAGPYPFYLKARIASERGHLSNRQAAELLAELAHENLRAVVAMHVSQENNTYRLPQETLVATLNALEAPRVGCEPPKVYVAYQNRLVSIE